MSDLKWAVEEWLKGYPCSVDWDTYDDYDWEGRPIIRNANTFSIYAPVEYYKTWFAIAYVDSDGQIFS